MNPIDRDYTAFKICERTCKLDAYESVLAWSLSDNIDKESILWYLRNKIEGHKQFLEEMGMRYEYTTQNIIRTGSQPAEKK